MHFAHTGVKTVERISGRIERWIGFNAAYSGGQKNVLYNEEKQYEREIFPIKIRDEVQRGMRALSNTGIRRY